jgi:hypothetical protein
MPADETTLHAILRKYRWRSDMPADQTWRENPTYLTTSRDYGRTWATSTRIFDTIAEVKTDRGLMELWGLSPHSYNSSLHRLAGGRIMGLFVGRPNLLAYNSHRGRMGKGTEEMASDVPLAGFSRDGMQSWTFRVIADKSQGNIGFSESDSVVLPSGRIVAIYGNNSGSPWFFETHSDDAGQSWSPMRQLNFRGDSPSMIRLSNGALLAAIRSLPEGGAAGIGLVLSADEGATWELLGNIHDQKNWDMAYPDLIRLADGRILCVYYTGNERQAIPDKMREEFVAVQPMRTQRENNPRIGKDYRPAAFGEIQSEIRGIFLEERS